MHLRFLLTLLSFLFFQSDPPVGSDLKDPKDPPKPDDVTFDAKQQAKINDMLAAERKSAEERTAQRLKDEAAAQIQKDKEQRERDEAAKRGEFDQVKSELEGKVSTIENERDAFRAERDALAEYVKADIAAVTKAVKDAKDSAAAKALLDFYPGDDAEPTALLAWAAKAKPRLGEIDKQSPRGNGQDPKPGGKAIDIDAEVAKTRRTIRI